MKICAACNQELPKESFSKKQWQLKQRRRCKECIADNREVQLSEAPLLSNDAPPSMLSVEGGASDEDLFKEPPLNEECPICFRPLPSADSEITYHGCCGKEICTGCLYAVAKTVVEEDCCHLCPFCRTPAVASDEETIERVKERAAAGDAKAIYNLGCKYNCGVMGLRQSYKKAIKLWLRAGEFGCTRAYSTLASSYYFGKGVKINFKKAKHYWELAAMGGDVDSRYNLGTIELDVGRKVKHWMIAVGAGDDKSLRGIRACYLEGLATKDEYEKALRTHQAAKDEMKSDQRDAAAADKKFVERAQFGEAHNRSIEWWVRQYE